MLNKVICFLVLGFLFSCKQKEDLKVETTQKDPLQKESILLFSSLPKHLTKLTEINNEWVVFNPCNAENGVLNINKKEILWLEGHEAERLTVKKVMEQLDKIVLDIESLNVMYKAGVVIEKNSDELFRITNKLYGGNREVLFVDTTQVGNYKVINQPCKECWEDCE